jgi:hypothetical protein
LILSKNGVTEISNVRTLERMEFISPVRTRGFVFTVIMLLLAHSVHAANPSFADLPEQEFQSLAEKTNLYVKALNAARNVQRSYDRYASWLDVKKGPTGKERYIMYGPASAAARCGCGCVKASRCNQDARPSGKAGRGLL